MSAKHKIPEIVARLAKGARSKGGACEVLVRDWAALGSDHPVRREEKADNHGYGSQDARGWRRRSSAALRQR